MLGWRVDSSTVYKQVLAWNSVSQILTMDEDPASDLRPQVGRAAQLAAIPAERATKQSPLREGRWLCGAKWPVTTITMNWCTMTCTLYVLQATKKKSDTCAISRTRCAVLWETSPLCSFRLHDWLVGSFVGSQFNFLHFTKTNLSERIFNLCITKAKFLQWSDLAYWRITMSLFVT